MITIAKLTSMAKNKKRLSSMLDGTAFTLVHYSVGSPMLRTSPNPHCYVVMDTHNRFVINGLKVFMSTCDAKIAALECWKSFDKPEKREWAYCDSENDRDKVIGFLESKRKIVLQYMTANGMTQ